jgi:hypothetical protein
MAAACAEAAEGCAVFLTPAMRRDITGVNAGANPVV